MELESFEFMPLNHINDLTFSSTVSQHHQQTNQLSDNTPIEQKST